eukprot:TRINITY_DN11458_c0_g2_i1.p1 TRINITY_DN11458_c0_g2~~TRINITY_DN11458_c0_g2_i1.p1  ORF type:complete len:357 (-),score=84.16 TRINITY_DN11458_c0_g2_i1:436-1506(-)
MSRMEELQARKRAERTADSDMVGKSSGLAPAAPSTPGVCFNATSSDKGDGPPPVTQTELNVAAQGMDMVFDPTNGSSHYEDDDNEDDDRLAICAPSDIHEFVSTPFTDLGVVQCQIFRHKSGLFNSYPSYELYLKDGMRFMVAARKRKKTTGAYYIMSLSKDEISRHDKNFIGKVRSNFTGTQFNIFDSGVAADDKERMKNGSGELRKDLGFINYESNILGSKGPRKMTVALPLVNDQGQAALFTQSKDSPDVPSLEAAVGEDGNVENVENVFCLVNRAPKWSERLAAYTLDFRGRVTMASVKNFQLVEDQEDDRILLQFGKVGTDEFTMDFRAPLTPMQAFGICLSSLDNKLACE